MKKVSCFIISLSLLNFNCLKALSNQIVESSDKMENSIGVESISKTESNINTNIENNNTNVKDGNLNKKNTTNEKNKKIVEKNINITSENKKNELKIKKTSTPRNNDINHISNEGKNNLEQKNNLQNLKQNIKQDNKKVEQQKYHIVQEGENVYIISLKYGIKQQELIELNQIKNNNSIYIGQKLILPHNYNVQTAKNSDKLHNKSSNKTSTSKNSQTNKKELIKQEMSSNNSTLMVKNNQKTNGQRHVEQKMASSNKEPIVKSNQEIIKNKKTGKKDITSDLTSTTFIWPVYGILSSKFGYPTRSGKLEGVNITCETNSVVRASSSGIVVYSDKVEDYNNVIIIKHYNGFFTAYGYVEPLVKVDDVVKKGQVIAYTAQNKQSKKSRLYFLIRKNKKSYDPEELIKTKISG